MAAAVHERVGVLRRNLNGRQAWVRVRNFGKERRDDRTFHEVGLRFEAEFVEELFGGVLVDVLF